MSELYKQKIRWWCDVCNADYRFLWLAQKCCGGRVHKVEQRCPGDCDVCSAEECSDRKCEMSLEAMLS